MSDLGITPLTPAQEQAQEQKVANENYFERSAVAVDQELNVVAGGRPDETISARCSRDAKKHRLARWIIKGLNVIQRNHGPQAVCGDLERAESIAKIERDSGQLPK